MPAKTTQPSEDVNNPYGYSDMDWAAPLDPAYAAARAEVRRLSVGEDGTLSVKVKIPAASGGALEGRSLLCWGNLSPKPPNKDAIPPHRKQWGILASFREILTEEIAQDRRVGPRETAPSRHGVSRGHAESTPPGSA